MACLFFPGAIFFLRDLNVFYIALQYKVLILNQCTTPVCTQFAIFVLDLVFGFKSAFFFKSTFASCLIASLVKFLIAEMHL